MVGSSRRSASLLRVLLFTFFGILTVFLSGFIYFLSQIEAAERPRTERADAIVVFSGEPKRIEVGSSLLASGRGRHLIIVGQDNADEIAKAREAHQVLFRCCVEIDASSTNTEQDAILAKRLLEKIGARSTILVTSSFHIPRATVELRRQVPRVKIVPFGVADDFYKIRDILISSETASAFLSQYVLYASAGIPGTRNLLNEHRAHGALSAVTKPKNIALVLIILGAMLSAGFAFSRHGDRFR